MNPEKTGVRTSETFIQAVETARTGEFDLRSYCERCLGEIPGVQQAGPNPPNGRPAGSWIRPSCPTRDR